MSGRVWYANTQDQESADTMHQIFIFGSLDEIRELKRRVGKDRLEEMFLQYPKKAYTKQALNFIKNIVLQISSSIDEQQYLKSTPRYPR